MKLHTNTLKKPSYYEYIKYLKALGWKHAPTILTEESDIVKGFSLKNGVDATFIDIKCLAGTKISIPGIHQFEIDEEHLMNYPTLYTYPYSVGIKCTDDEGEEPSLSRITITKKKAHDFTVPIEIGDYNDLKLNVGSRFKSLEDRFYFEKGIEMNGEEHMLFSMCPDIDIENVSLYMKVDIWTANEK